jgi:hypothetical protein
MKNELKGLESDHEHEFMTNDIQHGYVSIRIAESIFKFYNVVIS